MQTVIDIRQHFATMSVFMQELGSQKSPRKKKQRSVHQSVNSSGEDLDEDMNNDGQTTTMSGGTNLDSIHKQYDGYYAEQILSSCSGHQATSPLWSQATFLITYTNARYASPSEFTIHCHGFRGGGGPLNWGRAEFSRIEENRMHRRHHNHGSGHTRTSPCQTVQEPGVISKPLRRAQHQWKHFFGSSPPCVPNGTHPPARTSKTS